MTFLSNRHTNTGKLFFQLLFGTAAVLSPLYAIAATHTIEVLDPRSFSPNSLTIEVGDTVRWTNASGGMTHNVTADDGSFRSSTSSSFTFEMTFNSVAEILYHCTIHSTSAASGGTAMNGSINVIAATGSADISVESINAIDGAYEAGKDFRVMTTLKNLGDGNSGAFKVNFYASPDSEITSGDTLLGSINISNLAAGGSVNLDESVDLPGTSAAGEYFIGAISDLNDSSPGNNSNVDETSIFVFTQFIMNAGLNDAWYNPATNGQGFFITVFPDLNFVTLAWFTYDTELPPVDATANLGDPGHRWMTAGGVINNDMAVLDIEFTSGGIFDTPSEIVRTDPLGADGTLTLKFDNCGAGTIDYDITTINAQGTVPIQRVANDNIVLCDALLRESQ
ncbi:MAG: CARDB domain-containing protein [Xanthomonadales bacterium]|nr:CARDB domain-containing protein [Xanthomonadales bacterium]